MLQQIIIHTPLWVWAMLAFLLYRGWSAAADRESTIAKVALIPLLMLALSGHGVYQLAHVGAWVFGVAILAAVLSGRISWAAAGHAGTLVYPARGMVFLRGSWLPLLMMVSVFAVKYVVGVMQAMHVGLVQGAGFTAVLSLVYGLFIGVSMGRLLRILHLYRQAQLPAAQLSS